MSSVGIPLPVSVKFEKDYHGHKAGAVVSLKTEAELETGIQLARGKVLSFVDKAVADLVKATQKAATAATNVQTTESAAAIVPGAASKK